MKLLLQEVDVSTYEVSDENETGKPIYLKMFIGAYGPWVEIYRSNPLENTELLPDSQIHLDYFNRKLRLRFWCDGIMKTAESDDIDPSSVLHVFNQEPLEQNEE